METISRRNLIIVGLGLALSLFALSPAHAKTKFSFTGNPVVTAPPGTLLDPIGDVGDVGTTARWDNIGKVNRTRLDLVIEVISNSQEGTSATMSFSSGGSNNDDAVVRLEELNQVVELAYHFYERGTSTPVFVIPEGLFQDLDGSGSGSLEIVRVLQADIASYTLEGPDPSDTSLTVSSISGDTVYEVTSNFNCGTGCNYPDTTQVAIEFDFQPTSSISVTFETTSSSGRNFAFDGNASAFFGNPKKTKRDTTPPAVPTIDGVPINTNDSKPELTGTAEAYSTVTAVIAGATFEVVASGTGTWLLDTGIDDIFSGSFNPVTDGSSAEEIVLTSSDAAENSTSDTTNNELTITAVVVIDDLSTANFANQASYPVSGDCVGAWGNVSVEIEGVTPVQSLSCSSARWSTNFNVSLLGDGVDAISVLASQVDLGAATVDADPKKANKDVVAPATPSYTAQLTNSTTPVLTGGAEADASVEITVGGATFTVSANGSGVWSLESGYRFGNPGLG